MSVNNPSNPKTTNLNPSFVEAADCLLDELSGLMHSGVSPQKFYRWLVDRLELLLTAQSVSVWLAVTEEAFQPILVSSRRGVMRDRIGAELFFKVIENRHAQIFMGPKPFVLVPFAANGRSAKVLLCEFSPGVNEQLLRVYCDLGDAVAELAMQFETQLAVSDQDSRFQKLETFVQLLCNSTATLEIETFGLQFTNDCRSFLTADRVWLFSNESQLKLIACSGVSEINRRAQSVKEVSNVARRALRQQESVFLTADNIAGMSSEDAAFMERHELDGFYAVVLREPNGREITGVLVVEFFGPHDRVTTTEGIQYLLPTLQTMFHNVQSHHQIPFRRGLEFLRRGAKAAGILTIPRMLLILGLLGSFVAATFLITDEFEILVEGELRPRTERHIFAPADATVDELLVQTGDQVQVGQTVALLTSKDLDFKLNESQNELSTTNKRWQATKLLRTQAVQGTKDEVYLSQLSAELEQLELEMEALNRKVDWINEQRNELKIAAPIAGQIVTQDVEMRLLKRPVRVGSSLLTIADTKSDWHLIFKIPDREYGYLLQARRDGDVKDWKVQYRFKSEMETIREATIDSVENYTTFSGDGEAMVRAFASLKHDDSMELRVGQNVNATINCGRKSLFFIWTRDVRDFAKRNFLW